MSKNDIVKCPNPDCEATQQIWIDADGDVACVFCGTKITDLPEGVDLSAYRAARERADAMPQDDDVVLGERVPADDPNLPKGECVRAEYSLQYGEVESALYSTEKIETTKKRQIVYTAIIAAFLIFEAVNIVILYRKGDSIVTSAILSAMMLVILPYLWIAPKRQIKKYISSVADGKVITTEIYENLVTVNTDDSRPATRAMLDGSCSFAETDDLFLLVLKNGSVVIVPKRSLPDGTEQTVRQRLADGAQAYESPSQLRARAKAERKAAKPQPDDKQ